MAGRKPRPAAAQAVGRAAAEGSRAAGVMAPRSNDPTWPTEATQRAE